ncbi:hypothetical protein DYB30_012518 [Aphanomyces astaci]|uniref:DDE-1 domain-containing protein n=1 Tax=Aphanomyces astaci TaxID=112090 RepID=A0A397CSU4_APHAT|nr:hypothetical protein DYB30_012518 [Aphanomyces astaci]
MRKVRGDSHNLTTSHMITWLKTHQPEWLESYLGNQTNDVRAYKCLLAMCQRFAHRHGFAQRVPCFSKLKKAELQEIQMSFSVSFWTKYGEQPLRDIVNVDETAVNYDMPPRRIWCEVGETSEVEAKQKHSDRLTVVLAICADAAPALVVALVVARALVVALVVVRALVVPLVVAPALVVGLVVVRALVVALVVVPALVVALVVAPVVVAAVLQMLTKHFRRLQPSLLPLPEYVLQLSSTPRIPRPRSTTY